MLVKLHAAALQGTQAREVHIEVSVGKGAQYFMVGLPDSAVRESWKRMETAILASGFKMPRQRIVINLAPADQPKHGSSFDLPMAVGILAASGQLPAEALKNVFLMGELALDGCLRSVPGSLPVAMFAASTGAKAVIVPAPQASQASWAEAVKVYGANTLKEVAAHLKEVQLLPRAIPSRQRRSTQHLKDFSEVRGQYRLKRALEIAAAGGHHVLLNGPPGSGKSMLARRMPGILPALSNKEALECTQIYSVCRESLTASLIEQAPFRAPHHSCSSVAITGGGSPPKPGEISLAHNGVLYLDEMPEFQRRVLEVLRQPLEEGKIAISRARYQVEFPARAMLIASMNPCPCGYLNHPTRSCVCSPGQIARYQSRISGPLLDRFDIKLQVAPVSVQEITSTATNQAESSEQIRTRVVAARTRQQERYQYNILNGHLSAKLVAKHCQPDTNGLKLLSTAMEKLHLSARAYHRVLKVARTIADLDECKVIGVNHVAEAVGYRDG